MPMIRSLMVLSALVLWGCGGSSSDPSAPPPPPPPPGTGSIEGSVLDIEGTAVADATVTVTGPENRSTQSNASGNFQFTGLETGDYSVAVEPPSGFVIALGAEGEVAVNVTAGSAPRADFLLATEADANVLVVRLEGLTFSPNDVTIGVGHRIRWVATEPLLHTVTPDGHSEWSEPTLSNPGDTFEHTFDTSGDFDYFCSPHLNDGMTGVIRVSLAEDPFYGIG